MRHSPVWIGLLLLSACGGPEANVRSADPYERFLGVRANEGRRDAPAVAEVVHLLEDPHYLVVAGALSTLAEMGQPEFLQHAAPLTQHKHPMVRREACATIARIRNPLGVPFLLKAVEDPDAWVRRGAVKALGAFPQVPDARTGLLKAFEDKEAGVVMTAHETLQAVTGRLDVARTREAWAGVLK
jgi:HEAT repeat protein